MKITIEIEADDAAETLREIARQIDNGMTSGYYPSWEIMQ